MAANFGFCDARTARYVSAAPRTHRLAAHGRARKFLRQRFTHRHVAPGIAPHAFVASQLRAVGVCRTWTAVQRARFALPPGAITYDRLSRLPPGGSEHDTAAGVFFFLLAAAFRAGRAARGERSGCEHVELPLRWR